MDIGQGAGLSGASGVRPFLPTLLAGALASGDIGLDFDGTSYSFLEQPWFLLIVLVLAVTAYAIGRREQAPRALDLGPAALGLVLGALLFAGSLADTRHTSWWGLIAGAGCALLGFQALAALFARARGRLTGGAAALIDVYADGVALLLAGIAIALPPVAFLGLAAFAVLIVRSRGESAQKYGGLRILR